MAMIASHDQCRQLGSDADGAPLITNARTTRRGPDTPVPSRGRGAAPVRTRGEEAGARLKARRRAVERTHRRMSRPRRPLIRRVREFGNDFGMPHPARARTPQRPCGLLDRLFLPRRTVVLLYPGLRMV
jgi:hypothetical protein